MWSTGKKVRALGKMTIRSYTRLKIAESFDEVHAPLSCSCAGKVKAYQEHQCTLNDISKLEELAKTVI